jgi:phosphotransferase system  glucose/maltose/N-acetylglucosamine-specific IIC component
MARRRVRARVACVHAMAQTSKLCFIFLLYLLIKKFNHYNNFMFMFIRTKLDYIYYIIFEYLFVHFSLAHVLMQASNKSCIYPEYNNTNN